MVAGMPQALPYIIKMIQWVTASFRSSDDIETVLDEAAKQAQANPPKGPEDKPDTSLETAQIKAKVDSENNQRDNETKVKVAQMQIDKDLKIAGEELDIKRESETQKYDLGILAADTTKQQAEEAKLKEAEAEQQDIAKQIKDAVDQLAQALMEKIEANLELKDIMAKMTQPRRKVPKYDAEGNIVQVDEMPIEDQESE